MADLVSSTELASRVNLFNFDRKQLADYFAAKKQPRFRADQVIHWLHQKQERDITKWHNISLALRCELLQDTTLELPLVAQHFLSQDGTQKFLMRLSDGNQIETVYIPENGRGTLCISSQVGCALNCQFCATARQGFNRNLTVAEIIGQLWQVQQFFKAKYPEEKVTNVVMMGMGEPLLNFEAVVSAMDLMMDDLAYGLSKYRVTLSTSGVVPAMRLLSQRSEAALAVSLHAPHDDLRTQLVPINRKYPLEMLIAACRDYFPKPSKRMITFEYVMLAGVNDHPEHARALVRLLRGVPAKINLIPFNPFPGAPYICSKDATINQFRAILSESGLVVVTRKTRGDDIQAACGQLVGAFQDRTQRRANFAALSPRSAVAS